MVCTQDHKNLVCMNGQSGSHWHSQLKLLSLILAMRLAHEMMMRLLWHNKQLEDVTW